MPINYAKAISESEEELHEYWQHSETLIRLTAYPCWVEVSKYHDNFIVN